MLTSVPCRPDFSRSSPRLRTGTGTRELDKQQSRTTNWYTTSQTNIKKEIVGSLHCILTYLIGPDALCRWSGSRFQGISRVAVLGDPHLALKPITLFLSLAWSTSPQTNCNKGWRNNLLWVLWCLVRFFSAWEALWRALVPFSKWRLSDVFGPFFGFHTFPHCAHCPSHAFSFNLPKLGFEDRLELVLADRSLGTRSKSWSIGVWFLASETEKNSPVHTIPSYSRWKKQGTLW